MSVLFYICILIILFFINKTTNIEGFAINNKIKYPQIDIVYTWVDNKDKNWKRKKAIYSDKNINFDANIINRFSNNNELKYSLRSIYKYANWVNTIYIVVMDGQQPDWLNLRHPKIKLVNHSHIISKEYLPTFNSHVIEANLYKIKGLSENFLYFNDDMFLGNYIKKSDIISKDGSPYYFKAPWNCKYIGKSKNTNKSYVAAWKNNNEIINKLYPDKKNTCPWHQATPCQKSIFRKLVTMYPERFIETSQTRFRSNNNIAPIGLASVYSFKSGHSILKKSPSNIYIRGACIGNVSQQLDNIMKKRPKFFCINDINGKKKMCS